MKTIKRLAARTAIFFILTVLAFAVTQPLTKFTGQPDVLRGLTAAAVLAWAEISITWLRVVLAPNVDEQEIVQGVIELACPVSLAVVYASNAIKWAVRLAAFIYIYSGVL